MKWVFTHNHSVVFACLFALNLAGCSERYLQAGAQPEDVASTKSYSLPSFYLNSVQYQGVYGASGQTLAYRGVPFAAPPVGQLRWQAPKPLSMESSTYRADKFAPACMQGPHLANWYKGVIKSFGGDPSKFESPAVSEDCLYLNIWAPKSALDADRQLPVYVFIHGGSNKGGWSYEPNYIGEKLASQGAIVVTIAYRLGVFGFFSHPELHQANFALMDQIAALKWVRDNIHLLGGDNKRITVAGESAGANNIAYLLASPMAEDLFQRVIFQSGGWALSQPITARQEALKLGQKFAQAVLTDQDRQPANDTELERLRAIDAQDLLLKASQVYRNHSFDPVVDGHSVVEPLSKTMARSELAAVDIIVGSNADEQLMYLAEDETIDSWIATHLSGEHVAPVKAVLKDKARSRQTLDDLATAHGYACPALKLAQSVVKSGGNAWAYYFARVREGELAGAMGAYHGAELPYIFNTHDDWLPTSLEDDALTREIQNYWLNFMGSGNPNGPALKEWPRFSVIGDQVMELSGVHMANTHPSEELCKIFWPSE